MRFWGRIGIVFLLTLLAPDFAMEAQAQSFLGEWTATAETPGGGVSETITAVKTEKGYAVTAKLIGVPEDTPMAGPGTDIVLEGDRFSYKRSIPTPDGPVIFTYTGVVSGDRFTGTAGMAGFEVPYTGIRVTREGGQK